MHWRCTLKMATRILHSDSLIKQLLKVTYVLNILSYRTLWCSHQTFAAGNLTWLADLNKHLQQYSSTVPYLPHSWQLSCHAVTMRLLLVCIAVIHQSLTTTNSYLCCQTLTTWLSCISCINDVFSRMHGYSSDPYYYYYNKFLPAVCTIKPLPSDRLGGIRIGNCSYQALTSL
jgi:hypothetical protein